MAKAIAREASRTSPASIASAQLTHYADGRHDTGAAAYRIGRDFIVVQFSDGRTYLYTHAKPGRDQVKAMKALAARGRGLTTYINQHIRADYARRLH